MSTQRHCDVCNGWHDLEQPWPQACFGHYRKDESNTKSLQVLGDLKPYRNTIDGTVIGGRRQHREFLRRHNVVEVGNEDVKQKYVEPPPVAPDIKRALEEHGWRG